MTTARRPRFGEQRLVRPGTTRSARLLYQMLGVADPAHYLHSRYFRDALDTFVTSTPVRILDAGCGAGDYSFYLARRYPRAEITGVDLDVARIARNHDTARRLGIRTVHFEVADLTTADFLPEPCFDLIVSVDVLEHIAEQDEVLARLYRALRPGGIAFLHVPTIRHKPVPLSRFLTHFHKWAESEHVAEPRSAEELIAAIRIAGFEVLSERRTFGRCTGELATSLFALPHTDNGRNRMWQGLLAPVCRMLALADQANIERERYAVAIIARRASDGERS
jgi:2-polyprenyl-3-methyl-5-hydroxy-6-metoxy-1,4-benzoquinol methylase